MPAQLSVDPQPIIDELVKMKAFHRKAHKEATVVLAGYFIRRVDELARQHHDTNRYINGYIAAGIDLGLEGLTLKPYKRSAKHEEFVELLERQYEDKLAIVNRLQKKMAWYRSMDINAKPRLDGKPRKKRTKQKYFKKLERAHKKAEKRMEQALDYLTAATSNESVVFFYGRKGRKLKSGKTGKSRLISSRHKIYGGKGSIEQIGDRVFITLENLEPHARLVESFSSVGHPARTAMNELGVVGLQRAGKRYIERQAYYYMRKPVSLAQIRAENDTRHALLFHTG